MNYRPVGRRCALHLDSLQLPISHSEIIDILTHIGYEVVAVNMCALARAYAATATYRLRAHVSEAPRIVDCASFTKWLYAECGIWLPRLAIQQRAIGQPVTGCELKAGDLVFTSGKHDYYVSDPSDGVGHVGIYIGEDTIAHVTNLSDRARRLVTVDQFITPETFRGTRRILPDNNHIVTVQVPGNELVETSDDLRWKILRLL